MPRSSRLAACCPRRRPRSSSGSRTSMERRVPSARYSDTSHTFGWIPAAPPPRPPSWPSASSRTSGSSPEVGFDAAWLLACILVLRGAERYEGAVRALDLALEAARRRGAEAGFATASVLRASVLLNMGDVPAAEADARAALEAAPARNWLWLPVRCDARRRARGIRPARRGRGTPLRARRARGAARCAARDCAGALARRAASRAGPPRRGPCRFRPRSASAWSP